jgi:alpha-N-arabinofuranosidase
MNHGKRVARIMKRLTSFFLFLTALLLAPLAGLHAQTVTLRVDPGKSVGHIDERIYGHFLEHIYHSCNGGLWGEVVWNRSFEETCSRDTGWRVSDGVLETPPDLRRETRVRFQESWHDYEFTLDAQKTGGDGELWVVFREDVFGARDTLVLGQEIRLEHFGRNPQTRQEETVTLATARGTVANDHWQQIRVRCEKQHLQVWLNGQPLFDVTDPARHLWSGIGVGARHATGRFRQFHAASLDGKALLDAPLPWPARHWRATGAGTVALSTDQPLNSRFCLNLIGDAGVSQAHFCLRPGDGFRGSLWARGEGALAVQLGDDEKRLSPLSADWKEYPLEFAPHSGDTLQITGHGNVFVDQVSLRPDSARATGGFRPDLLDAVAALRPPLIRWPGGTFVAGYNWKNAIGPQEKRVGKNGWDELDPLSFGIDEFIALCRKAGAEPLICVNVGLNKPELVRDACDFIEYCNGAVTTKWGAVRAAHGHREPYNVKQWEIGNEMWSIGATNYVEIVRQFVPPMKKADPTIQVSVCGNISFDLQWNAAVIAGCAELTDYLSIHHYESPARFADGPAKYAAFWRETGKLIAASKNPQMKLFVSEWNASSTDWRTGLYCGGLLNEFERAADLVTMATPALFLRRVTAPDWDNAFINFDSCAWFPAPNYVVMKLWRDHFAATRLAVDGDAGPLNVVATRSDDGRTLWLKAVNPSAEPRPVKLAVTGGFQLAGATLKLVAPDDLNARNSLAQPDAVRVVSGKVELLDGRTDFVLPRWSAAVLELQSPP